MYNGILELEIPKDPMASAFLEAYADDIVAIITARNTDAAPRKINQVIWRMGDWLKDHSLQLATQKTEL